MTDAAFEHFLTCLKANQSYDEAKSNVLRLFGTDEAKRAGDLVREKFDKVYLLRDPPMIVEHGSVEWYVGPDDNDLFWPPLKNYLISKGWKDTIDDLDAASTEVVSRLAPPGRTGFRTRGLVVGYVQSGKTANFTAVIAKAADVHYNVFIVLSGLTNALRNQTQSRLEQELVLQHREKWLTLTAGERDFNVSMPVAADVALNKAQKILVVLKKNDKVLMRFNKWLRGANPKLLEQCALLIIDDEADQASINTAKNEESRKGINKRILEMLQIGPKAAYIGYTATPFANVLNEPPGDDSLYPRDFIAALPRPDNYFGPEKIFGRERTAAEEEDSDIDGIDVIRSIPDKDAERLRQGREAFSPAIVPTLEEAIRYFWLATAARLARSGQIDFSTMLVHTSLKTDIHEVFKNELTTFQNDFKARMHACRGDLKGQWDREIARLDSEKSGCASKPVSFDELWPHFVDVVSRTGIKVDNHRSRDRLDYSPAKKGSIYLVVGGNTLSRGLTLEGLVVSYFVRTSTAYDTLMQMGRWFGYRKDYEDLPRIWMTDELRDYFFDLATVEEDFRAEVRRYSFQATPSQFGPRIRTHPSLSITSRMKMQAAMPCQVSYAGKRPQTILFKHKDKDWLDANVTAARELGSTIKTSVKSIRVSTPGRIVCSDVPATIVLSFLDRYKFHERNRQLSSQLITSFIRAQNELSMMLHWNVVWIGHEGAPLGTFDTGIGNVGLLNRSRMGTSDPLSANVKAVMSLPDIVADLSGLQSISGLEEEELFRIRKGRFPKHGLLLLYPISRHSKPKPGRTVREPLDAVQDVIGLAVVCPSPERDTPQGYMTVDMSKVFREELDFDEDAEDDASGGA